MSDERKTVFRREVIAAELTPKMDFQFREKRKKGAEDVSEG